MAGWGKIGNVHVGFLSGGTLLVRTLNQRDELSYSG